MKPLVAQRLLWSGLLAVAGLSAFLLWFLHREDARGRSGAARPGEARASLPDESRAPEVAPPAPVDRPPDELEMTERTAVAAEQPLGAETATDAFAADAVYGYVRSREAAVSAVELSLFPGAGERRELGVPLARAKSDAQGRFRMEGLRAHERYVLHLEHPAFLPSEETVFPGHAEELELTPSATVSGVVRSAETLQSLEGVTVALERWHADERGPSRLWSSTSDAEGRWQLSWVEPGIERFTVLRRGCLPEWREFQVGPEGGEGFEILVSSGAALELEVYALESGAVLADTELRSDETSVHTDARGRLVLPSAPGASGGDSLRISLSLEGGCLTQGRIDPKSVHGFLRAPVTRGGTVRGRVTDAAGAPVSGASLRLSGGGRLPSGISLPEGFWINPARNGAESGADGSFVLTGLPPREGQVQLRAQHPEYPPARSEPFAFAQLGMAVEVDVRLERGGTITGRVRLDGEPAALRVCWNAARGTGWTRSDDRGDYRVAGVPAGEVTLGARLEGEDEDIPRPEDVVLFVAEDDRLTADFDLAGNRSLIRGRVLDTRGEPVAAAEVVATLSVEEGEDAELVAEPRTESADDGSFELSVSNRPGLTFDVRAEDGPRRAQASGVAAGGEDIELVLPALTPLVLRVVDALHHEPLGGFQLYWRESETGSFERLVQGARRFSPGPDGTFTAELPSARLDLVVSARAAGFVPAQRDGIDLFPTAPPPVTFELERGVELELAVSVPPEAETAWQQLKRGRVVIASDEQLAERERGGDYYQQEVRNAQAVRLENGVAHLAALASGHYRFINVPKGFAFQPKEFELPPVANHRLAVSLAPEARKKPAARGD